MSIDVVSILGAVHGPWVYAVVVIAAMLESAAFVGLVVPGETILLLAGATAAVGGVNLVGILVCGVLGAVAGDQVGYSFGRTFGDGLRRGRLGRRIGAERWARAEALVMRRGGPAVFLARWIGVLRALVPAVAGAVLMPRRTFALWNALGGTLWAASVVGGGFLVGTAWPSVVSWLGLGAAVLASAVGVALAVVLARRVLLRRRVSADYPIEGPGTSPVHHEHIST